MVNSAQVVLFANLAHLAEQHPRNVQVLGSSPRVGFFLVSDCVIIIYKIRYSNNWDDNIKDYAMPRYIKPIHVRSQYLR